MIDQLAFLKEHFGDADGVLGLLGKHVKDVPQRPAVVKWFRRGSIPGEWLFLLLVALKREHGEWPDLEPFMGAPASGESIFD